MLSAPDQERFKSAFDTFVCYSRLKRGNQISGSINLRHSEGEKSRRWWRYYRPRGIIMPHQELMGDNGARLALTSSARNLNTLNNVASSMECDTDATLKERVAICSKLVCLLNSLDVWWDIRTTAVFLPFNTATLIWTYRVFVFVFFTVKHFMSSAVLLLNAP